METKERLTAKEVLEEVKCAINDCFVAQVEQKDDCIAIRFLNGQNFELHITEKK